MATVVGIFHVVYFTIWIMDMFGAFQDADSGLMAGIKYFAEIDWIGYPLRFGFRLADAIADTDGKDFVSQVIWLMYPHITYVFNYAMGNLHWHLLWMALLYIIAPSIFLDDSVDLESVDVNDWDTLYKPRAGIPAMVATLYSTAKFLFFNKPELEGEGEWGLSVGAFVYLWLMSIGIFLLDLLASPVLAVWSMISSVTVPLEVLI